MLYLQATHKARALLGMGRAPLQPPGRTTSALGNWLINPVPIGDRTALLFMSGRSLLSFPIMLGRHAPDLKDIPSFMTHGLSQLMQGMGTPKGPRETLLRNLDEIAVCKADDKSILGMFSAVAADYFHRVDRAGGLAKAELGAVISAVNTTPRAPLGYRNSFEVSEGLFGESEA